MKRECVECGKSIMVRPGGTLRVHGHPANRCPGSGERHGCDVLSEVRAERQRQDAKFGEQNHDDGTGRDGYAEKAKIARSACQMRAVIDGPRWSLILLEEVYEALAESDPAKLRAELVQVGAVAVAWVEAIDRREASQ